MEPGHARTGSMRARAARLRAHGEPLVVEDVELGEPGPGEVVVDMAYGGVNPVDRYVALGRVGPDVLLPRTIGSEGAGTVDGRPVVVRGQGIWSTNVIVRGDALIEVPEGVPLDVAASIGVAGVTAWRTVHELAAVIPEDRVLVLGASGGVGSMIVSIAHRLGATVWGQTGSAAKAAFVAERGADQVIVADAEALGSELDDFSPTVVLDPLGGSYTGAVIAAMAPRGRLVLYGTSADTTGQVPLQALYRKSLRVMGYGGLMESGEAIAAGIRAALEAVRDGRLEVVIDSRVQLENVNTAFDRLVDRSVCGKVVLDLES